jgi:hypothetical protein
MDSQRRSVRRVPIISGRGLGLFVGEDGGLYPGAQVQYGARTRPVWPCRPAHSDPPTAAARLTFTLLAGQWLRRFDRGPAALAMQWAYQALGRRDGQGGDLLTTAWSRAITLRSGRRV